MLLHVYGVVGGAVSLPTDLLGRAGRPLRRVADEDLAVLVSDIDEDAHVRRDDLMVHAHLLEAVCAETTVIPTQFGVLLPDEDTVRREFLGNQRERLLGLLRAFDGCVQVTVHASYAEEAALREVLRRDPGLVGLRDAAAHDPGAQLALGEAVADALATVRGEASDLIVEELRPHLRAVALNETRGAYDVANLALLVDRADRPALDAAVGALGRKLEGRMNLRYVGPQPPYAFLEHVATEEGSWA